MIKAGNLFIPEGDKFFHAKFTGSGDKFDFASLRTAVNHSPRRGVAVDVGAHVGSWSVHLSRWFREVIAFEPNDVNYECLIANTKGIPNILCCNAALGKDKSVGSVTKHGTNSGCYRVVDGNDFQIVRLDDFGLMELDLLKIDVEGFEGAVIAGSMDVIGTYRPTIMIENNGLGPKLYKSDWIDPEPLLKRLRYKMVKKVQHDEVWVCA